jgi:hypothetical protein
MAENSGVFTRKVSIFTITVLMVVLTSCSNGSINQKFFYGSWQNIRDVSEGGTLKVTLSADSWNAVYTDSDGHYTVDQLSWVAAANDDPATKGEYPKGYYITGTASRVQNINSLSLGQQRTFRIYLNKDKTAFLRKNENNLSDYVFTKVE